MLAHAVDSVDPAARLHSSLPDSNGPVVAEKKRRAPNAIGNEGRLSMLKEGASQSNLDERESLRRISVIFCVIALP
jgi:hypothetical protein